MFPFGDELDELEPEPDDEEDEEELEEPDEPDEPEPDDPDDPAEPDELNNPDEPDEPDVATAPSKSWDCFSQAMAAEITDAMLVEKLLLYDEPPDPLVADAVPLLTIV